jgi:hypothetical protein
MALKLPAQGAIDRSIPLSDFLLTTVIADDNGNVLEKLVNPVGGPYSALPGDPAWFPARVDPRTAVCQALSPLAAIQCWRSRGYF